MTTKKLLILFLSFIFLASCYDLNDYKNISLEPFEQSWVIPLINSTVSFKDLVERSGKNTAVATNPDDPENPTLFYMVVRDTLDIGVADNEFDINPTGFNFDITIPQGLLYPGFGSLGPVIRNLNQNFEFVNDQELKLIDFHSGFLNLNITNHFNHPVNGKLKINSLKDDDKIYEKDFQLGNGPSNSSEIRTLQDWSMDLYDPQTGLYNNFRIEISFTIIENTSSTNYAGGLEISLDFSELDFNLIVGRINKEFHLADQVFPISAFGATLLAEQYFADPSFTLHFVNSYGIPVGINFPYFNAVTYSNQVIPFINTPGYTLNPTIDLNLSSYNMLSYMESLSAPPANTSLTLNAENSNIDEILSIAPNQLLFGTDIKLGDNSNNDYFIERESTVEFGTEIVIPLYGWATTHLLADTVMSMPWPDFTDLPITGDNFEVKIELKLTNELPLSIRFKMICLDDNLQETYTLEFDGDIDENGEYLLVGAALVNENGESYQPTVSRIASTLSKEDYMKVAESPNLILQYRLYTHLHGEELQPVKVLSTNNLKVQIFLHLKAMVKPGSNT